MVWRIIQPFEAPRCGGTLAERGSAYVGKDMRMKHYTRSIAAMVISAALLASTLGAGAKKYQVTGVVIELTDKMVVVEKPDGEKWELNRDPNAVVKGELKVGAKVTIQYTMTATNVEVKPAK